MPPVGPLLKNDGPACRVCGCTENNACPVAVEGIMVGCSWVETSGNDMPRGLCSACAGTEADMVEVLKRLPVVLGKRNHQAIDVAAAICTAALMRRHRSTHVDRGRLAMAPAKKTAP